MGASRWDPELAPLCMPWGWLWGAPVKGPGHMLGEGPSQPGIKTLSSQDAQQAAPSPFRAPVSRQVCGREVGSICFWSTEPWGSHVAAWPLPPGTPPQPDLCGWAWGCKEPSQQHLLEHPTSSQPHGVLTLPVRQTLTLSVQGARTPPSCTLRLSPWHRGASGAYGGPSRTAPSWGTSPTPERGAAGTSILKEHAARGPCGRPSALPS